MIPIFLLMKQNSMEMVYNDAKKSEKTYEEYMIWKESTGKCDRYGKN